MDAMNIGLIGILGEEYKSDLWGTLEKVADLGYRGIEGCEFLLDGDVTGNLKRFRDLGLQPLTVSSSLQDLREDLDSIRRKAAELESPKASMWWAPCKTREELDDVSETLNQAGRVLNQDGVKLCYHNHDQEFRNSFNGAAAMDILADQTDPEAVFFELDIAWIAIGGADPCTILQRFAGRVPCIHIKDVIEAPTREPKWTAVGTGAVPIEEAIRKALALGIEWGVVEQDKLRNLTGLETATVSILNLKERGLVR
jgi:sugar phosphate isomerase/epimerase